MKNVLDLKVAITHDTLSSFGGAERVVVSFLKLFPHADVYTLCLKPQLKKVLTPLTTGTFHSPGFYFSFINPEFLKPFAALYWESLDLSGYDLVLSSSHSFSAKSVITQPSTVHISYIHTPPRYLYTEYNESRWLKQTPWNILFSPVLSWLRLHDFVSAQRPDELIVNSKTVERRVQKYYRRTSQVVHPPVNVKPIRPFQKKDYYLVVSRLVKQKGIELAIKACNQLGKKLVVVGTGPELSRLQNIAGPTIEFKHFVEEQELQAYYAAATALLFCAQEEDFGLVVAEAMTHGVPVIGFNSGANVETIITNKTGIMFDEYSTEVLCNTILKFEKMSFNTKQIINFSRQFSQSRFNKKLTQIILKTLKKRYPYED